MDLRIPVTHRTHVRSVTNEIIPKVYSMIALTSLVDPLQHTTPNRFSICWSSYMLLYLLHGIASESDVCGIGSGSCGTPLHSHLRVALKSDDRISGVDKSLVIFC